MYCVSAAFDLVLWIYQLAIGLILEVVFVVHRHQAVDAASTEVRFKVFMLLMKDLQLLATGFWVSKCFACYRVVAMIIWMEAAPFWIALDIHFVSLNVLVALGLDFVSLVCISNDVASKSWTRVVLIWLFYGILSNLFFQNKIILIILIIIIIIIITIIIIFHNWLKY